MRYYEIPKGTVGKLISHGDKVKPWTTRKDLAFTATIIDPIRLHNRRSEYDFSELKVQLAEQGYALFSAEGENARHILAVPYDQVKVS